MINVLNIFPSINLNAVSNYSFNDYKNGAQDTIGKGLVVATLLGASSLAFNGATKAHDGVSGLLSRINPFDESRHSPSFSSSCEKVFKGAFMLAFGGFMSFAATKELLRETTPSCINL